MLSIQSLMGVNELKIPPNGIFVRIGKYPTLLDVYQINNTVSFNIATKTNHNIAVLATLAIDDWEREKKNYFNLGDEQIKFWQEVKDKAIKELNDEN